MDSKDCAIKTVDLTKCFGNFTANNKINLEVGDCEIKCIVGENGAGKSTLMNMLYGLLQPTEGRILIRGEEVNLKSPVDAIAHGIGMVHQHFKLVPSLTVYENVLLGAEIYKKKGGVELPIIDKEEEIRRVTQLIEENNIQLDPLAKVEDISVGECQRVEILKMLYRQVSILILDEPTACLTPAEVDELIESLLRLKKEGKTIIVITHKLREVMELADTVTVIKKGEVVGCVNKCDTSEAELAQMMVGRSVMFEVDNKTCDSISDEVLYEVRDLTTENTYGKKVVDHISFQVHKGEIFGIAGVEGNGQSELVKLICGLMESTEGSVIFDGEDVTNMYPEDLRARHLGIIPEDRYAQGLCKDLSIGLNCIAGYHKKPEVCQKGILKQDAIDEIRDELIDKFDIRISNKQGNISSLSGGNAQKVIVARELSNKPKVLIACQPTRGVDIGSIEFIHQQIIDFKNAGNTVILVSSELSEILSLADRSIVMCKGKIAGEFRPCEVSSSEIGLMMAGISCEGDERSEQ